MSEGERERERGQRGREKEQRGRVKEQRGREMETFEDTGEEGRKKREGEKRERGNKREREEKEKLTVQKSAISRTMTTTKLATKDLEKRPQRM